MIKIKIFKYISEIDCFIVDPLYKDIANKLGLNEWNEVVWIGRFFTLDQDYGEHWFDNWKFRDNIELEARKMGIPYDDLFVIDPLRFSKSNDGPCHSDAERKRFWTDVLISLELSIDTIVNEALKLNNERKELEDEGFVADLNTIINNCLKQINSTN